jgi:hypothetical protein
VVRALLLLLLCLLQYHFYSITVYTAASEYLCFTKSTVSHSRKTLSLVVVVVAVSSLKELLVCLERPANYFSDMSITQLPRKIKKPRRMVQQQPPGRRGGTTSAGRGGSSSSSGGPQRNNNSQKQQKILRSKPTTKNM